MVRCTALDLEIHGNPIFKINQFETHRDDHRLYLCHLPESTSDLLGGPKSVSSEQN